MTLREVRGRGVVDYVEERLERRFDEHSAGFGWTKAGLVVFAVVLHAIDFANGTCIISLVINEPKAVTRKMLRQCYDIVANQFTMKRAEFHIRADNKLSLKAAEKYGAKRVGVRRQAERDGTDVVVYDILRGECKWVS